MHNVTLHVPGDVLICEQVNSGGKSSGKSGTGQLSRELG